jgi:hypothetical protein
VLEPNWASRPAYPPERIGFDFSLGDETIRLASRQAGTLGTTQKFEIIRGFATYCHEAFIDTQATFVGAAIVAVIEP